MVFTKKFSEFIDGGDLSNDNITVGLEDGLNTKFNNPWTFLPSGTTAERPPVEPSMYYRVRLNTTTELYEYYNPTQGMWLTIGDDQNILNLLASHLVGDGASLIGLQDQSHVIGKTVQDLANATFIAQTDNGTLQNAQFLADLSTGIVRNTTTTGVLSILTGSSAITAIINDNTMATAAITNLPTSLAIKTYVDNQVAGSVTSAQGTVNQILVNATTGTPQTGALTLTLPQNIATTSSPTFSALTLTNALTVPNGGTGKQSFTAYALIAGGTTSTGLLQSLGTGVLGQLLQSGGPAGLPSWTTATFPSGSGTLNHMLRSDGTNWVQTTATTLDASDVLSGLTQLNVDNLRLDGNTISSTDSNGNINIVPNGTGSILSYTGSTFNSIYTSSIQSLMPIARARYNTGAGGNTGSFMGFASRAAAPGSFTTLNTGDPITRVVAYGDDGTQFSEGGLTQWVVSSAPSAGIMPCKYELYTSNSAGTRTLALTVTDAQLVVLANALPVTSGGTGLASTTINQLLYSSANNVIAGLATVNSAQLTTTGAGVPLWVASFGSGNPMLETDGTFVPALAFGGASVGLTYATQIGHYSRTGNVITFTLTITLSAVGTSVGTAAITGLPTAARTGATNHALACITSNLTYTGVVTPILTGSTITIDRSLTTAALAALTNTSFANNTSLIITGSYLV